MSIETEPCLIAKKTKWESAPISFGGAIWI